MVEDKSEDRDLEQEKRLANAVKPPRRSPEEYMDTIIQLSEKFLSGPPIPPVPTKPYRLPFFIKHGPSVSFACDIIETAAMVLIALFLAIGVFR